jgi:hypothetical protein
VSWYDMVIASASQSMVCRAPRFVGIVNADYRLGHSVVCGCCEPNYLRYYPDFSISREICQIDGRAAYVHVNAACQLPVTDPLVRVYLHAWHVTGNEFSRTITEEILDCVVREMTDPAGGFYSTQDADSEGEEGKFLVWTPDEIREVLGDESEAFMAAYGVTHHGNFEGKNILEFVGDMNQRPALAEARLKLFEAREKRVHPGRDDKVLTSLGITAKSPSAMRNSFYKN